jgi:ABC-2 type transport system permease protein
MDGADAYTAGIASSYVLRTIHQFQPDAAAEEPSPAVQSQSNTNDSQQKSQPVIEPRINILYNPGQISSWFFIPGILGACLTLTGTLVASATVLRERESGTMEQLLMTPASSWEILLAKIIPLAVFLLGDVFLAIVSARIIFGLPFRGDLLLFLIASALYAFVGIGLGMMLGSMCHSQRQAQLASFFINIPLILLSGTVVPLDTMPWFLQTLSLVDPLRYYTLIARGVILKGAGLTILWQQLVLLTLSAILVLTVSANRFRKQLV